MGQARTAAAARDAEVEPLRRASRIRLADQVVTILIDAMLDGRLPKGSSLPPERELATELDVNRTSLRQAIARLEQMGVVEARQGRGTVVRDIGTATDPALIAHLVARDRRKMLAELFEIRQALAGLIGRLAAERSSAADRRALRAAVEAVAQAPTARECQERELAFFRILVAAGRNRPLVAMQAWVDRAYGDAADLFTEAFEDTALITRGLEPIVVAVEKGDAVGATTAISGYAAASSKRLLSAAARRIAKRPNRQQGDRR